MNVDIPLDLVPFVHSVIASGRCGNECEVVREALELLERAERKREHLRADVLEGIHSGESLSRDDVDRHVREWSSRLKSER
jgi:putative addiction module CopG family antidote